MDYENSQTYYKKYKGFEKLHCAKRKLLDALATISMHREEEVVQILS